MRAAAALHDESADPLLAGRSLLCARHGVSACGSGPKQDSYRVWLGLITRFALRDDREPHSNEIWLTRHLVEHEASVLTRGETRVCVATRDPDIEDATFRDALERNLVGGVSYTYLLPDVESVVALGGRLKIEIRKKLGEEADARLDVRVLSAEDFACLPYVLDDMVIFVAESGGPCSAFFRKRYDSDSIWLPAKASEANEWLRTVDGCARDAPQLRLLASDTEKGQFLVPTIVPSANSADALRQDDAASVDEARGGQLVSRMHELARADSRLIIAANQHVQSVRKSTTSLENELKKRMFLVPTRAAQLAGPPPVEVSPGTSRPIGTSHATRLSGDVPREHLDNGRFVGVNAVRNEPSSPGVQRVEMERSQDGQLNEEFEALIANESDSVKLLARQSFYENFTDLFPEHREQAPDPATVVARGPLRLRYPLEDIERSEDLVDQFLMAHPDRS